MPLLAAAIFLSAFLLFLVQPLSARALLPAFGGAASVWTVCLMFFQATLLAGYAFAYASLRFLRPRLQGGIQLLLLTLSLVALSSVPSARESIAVLGDPTLGLVRLLLRTVGLPYFVLSTSSPLLQAWYARTVSSGSPYRLYALSNGGSLLALFVYPLLVEPLLPLSRQMLAWRAGYAGFVVLFALLAWRIARAQGAHASFAPQATESIGLLDVARWAALAFCPSALLLGVSNHLTQNLAPIPLLWVIPLGLYLLTFMLSFGSRGYSRRLGYPMFLVAVMVTTALLLPAVRSADLRIALPLFLFGFFGCAWTCHGELYLARPAPRHLGAFYLSIALGGALGGLFVGVLAPLAFRYYLELPLVLAASVLCIAWARRHIEVPSRAARVTERLFTATLLVALAYLVAWEDPHWASRYLWIGRNFYGVLRVEDVPHSSAPQLRQLHHGTVTHGSELLAPTAHSIPTAYYGPHSGVGLALHSTTSPRRIGVVGLGVGTLAAYGAPGDTFRFYELNAMVLDVARSWFYFLAESRAHVEIILGDARLSLESETPQRYDVLAVDAFSGDSVPVHLLTVEAFAQYFRHLAPSGVLAVHVSNRYLHLAGMVISAGRQLGAAARVIHPRNAEPHIFPSQWVVLSRDPSVLENAPWDSAETEPFPLLLPRAWTDDRSSLLDVLD